MSEDSKDILGEDFWRSHWRRAPYFVKGGARALLGGTFEESEFRASLAQMERRSPELIKRSREDVIFLQQVDRATPRLEAAARRMARLTSCPSVWADSVLAADGHSIGSHYDDSDNFVLQQTGAKLWRLHSPDIIPAEELRRRMLKEPGVGNIFMPRAEYEFLLEAGDLLYIPLFWAHWGVSRGPSLSVSLVCNTQNPLDELLPLLSELLSRDPAWWRPLPRVRLDAERLAPEAAFPEEVAPLFQELLARLREPALAEELRRDWWRERRRKMVALEEPPSAASAPAEAAPEDALPLDMERLRAVLTRPLPHLDVGRLVLAEGEGRAQALLREYVAKIHVKRFFVVASKAFPLLQEPRLRRSVRDAVVAFQRLPPEVLRDAILQPELTSWTWLSSEALESGYAPRFASLAQHLGDFLLPWLWREDVLEPGETLWLSPSTSHALHLLPLRRRLVSEAPLPAHLSARVSSGVLSLSAPGLAPLEVSLDRMCQPGRQALGGGWFVEELPTTRDGSVLVLAEGAWYEEFFPRDERGRTSPLAFDLSPDDFAHFRRCMSEGTELAHTYWPEAWAEFRESISLLLPLRWKGWEPHNASVHAYRGLITSSARPSYLAAQSLLHEAGHNRFSSILEVFKLYEHSDEERFYSPFVEDMRPMSAILHGIISFLQDIHITLRMRDRVPQIEDVSMERYLAKIGPLLRTALDTVHAKGRMTEQGQSLLDAFERAMPEGHSWSRPRR